MLNSLKASTSVVAGMIPTPVATTKPVKVSFRDRVKSLRFQNSKASSSISFQADIDNKINREKQHMISNVVPSKYNRGLALPNEDDKNIATDVAIRSGDTTSVMPSWSKLKKATVVSNCVSSHASPSNNINESASSGSQSIRIAKAKPTKNVSAITDNRNAIDPSIPVGRYENERNDRICFSDSEVKNVEPSRSKSKLRPKLYKDHGRSKSYRSVGDLPSLDFSGFPLVKRMRIFSQGKKLTELKTLMRNTPSLSLDNTKIGVEIELESLIRGHGEGLRMSQTKQSTKAITSKALAMEPTSVTIVPIVPLGTSHQISTESYETHERNQLKSILKKKSEEKQSIGQQSTEVYKGLLKAPTVEGYVARHNIFLKKVTFTSTLSSPPTSAHSLNETADDNSISPVLLLQPSNDYSQQKLPPYTRSDNSDSFLLEKIQKGKLQENDNQIHQQVVTSPNSEDAFSSNISLNPFNSNKHVKGNYPSFSSILYRIYRFSIP